MAGDENWNHFLTAEQSEVSSNLHRTILSVIVDCRQMRVCMCACVCLFKCAVG